MRARVAALAIAIVAAVPAFAEAATTYTLSGVFDENFVYLDPAEIDDDIGTSPRAFSLSFTVEEPSGVNIKYSTPAPAVLLLDGFDAKVGNVNAVFASVYDMKFYFTAWDVSSNTPGLEYGFASFKFDILK